MRLIKVNKSSRSASDAGLGDGLTIEVGELKDKGHRLSKTRSDKKGRSQGTNSSRKLNDLGDFGVTSDLFDDAINKTQSRESIRGKRLSANGNSSVEDVYNRGIYLLSMREHSVKELTGKLRQKFPASEEIELAVQRLSENDYVNDHRFTEAYVRQRKNKGLGPIKIRSELFSKGIKNKLIEQYLDLESPFWAESALAQYRKKYGDSKVEDYKDWARRARFLQSRGYSSLHIEHSVPGIHD